MERRLCFISLARGRLSGRGVVVLGLARLVLLYPLVDDLMESQWLPHGYLPGTLQPISTGN